MGDDFSHNRVRDLRTDALPARRAVSMIETLVVLFIISIMMGLLFPALMAARGKALTIQCQNNVRQLEMALSNAISHQHQFPPPNRWTVDLLKWMEEEPLADAMARGIPKDAVFPRPKPMQCPSQSQELSTVANVEMCHYVLVVDRVKSPQLPDRVGWDIIDRPEITDKDDHSPWYIGPEITFDQEQAMLTTRQGPHPGGLYYDGGGNVMPVTK